MAGLKKMEKARKAMIYLDEVMFEEIKERAQARQISAADLIRDALTQYLGQSRLAGKRAARTKGMRKAVRR